MSAPAAPAKRLLLPQTWQRASAALGVLLKSRWLPFAVFLMFIYLLSYEVFPTKGGILNYSDGAYLWPSSGFNFLSTWNASNLGFPFVAQSFTAFQYIPSLLTEFLFHQLANGDAYHSYVLYYGPVYASCLITFFLGRRVSGSALYGYFAGVFLILNNFMLEQLLVWPVSYFYCLVGLLLELYILWLIYEEGVTKGRLAGAILVSALVHHPFLFIVHSGFQVLFLAFACARGRVRYRHALLIIGGSVLLQAYWLMPFLYNLATTTVAETHRASGDSAYWGYIQIITYRNLFNLLNYPLLLDQRIYDNVHNFPQTAFNYLIVAMTTVSLIAAIGQRATRMKEILFFLAVYLFFFNLALGPNSQITGMLWSWAYVNVPGFAFFRSFNRFNVVALAALIMLGGLLLRSFEFRFKNHVLALVLVANIACYNVFFSGTFNGMVDAAYVPKEYYEANRTVFAVNKGGVILSLPHTPYESYKWAVNKRNDLTNPSMYFLSYFMNAPVILNQYAYMLDRQYPAFKRILDFYYDAKPFDVTDHESIRRLGVSHVMIHKDRVDTLRKNDRIVPWGRMYSEFAGNGGYVLKMDNAYFALFERVDPVPMIAGENVRYREVTETKYEVSVRNLAKPMLLTLAQSYNPGWKVYAAQSPPREWGDPLTAWGVQKNELFWNDIGHFFEMTVIEESQHQEREGFANGWILDPRELRHTLPPGSYEQNADGSLNVRLLVYFRPQALFTLGIGFSIVVALACLVALALALADRVSRGRSAPAISPTPTQNFQPD